MTSLAQYSDPVVVIATSLQTGQKGNRCTGPASPETVERIADLLRMGVRRGIMPQWSLRLAIGAAPSQEHLDSIADQIAEGFQFGEGPIAWRLDVYE